MRRSTGPAVGLGVRRALTFLLPLLAACISASSAWAGVRSGAATAGAIASALSQSTGLSPSQVTSEAVCPPAPAGFARCDAQALVLRSNHARVRPHVHGGQTFTQVFPTHARGIRSARPTDADAGASAPEPGTPAWLQQAYDLTYLSQTAGGTDTVAIVDVGDDPSAESDLGVFRSTYGLPACTTANLCFEKVNESGNPSPLPQPADSDWESEESLDLDAVSALCPKCKILLVEASTADDTDLDAAVGAAATLGANQISNSWSDDESSPIGGTYTFAHAAVIAATGDHGYVGGGYDAYPAAIPGVTAAGGTSLAPATGGQSARGFSESAWSLDGVWGGASGCDTQEQKPPYQDDVGCAGRAYSDLSADADPDTGLLIYDSEIGGWWQYGGTSLATPLIAAYEAITGVDGTTPEWAYTDSGLLNDPTTGSSGDCGQPILYICDAGVGYDGPTGIGSISGAVAPGAPGIGGPSFGYGIGNTYTAGVGATTASLSGGVYPNGLDTTYYWQYGTTTSYGSQTATGDIVAGQAPVPVTGALSGLAPGNTYHYRLVAHNDDGTMYGYDSELTTESAPINTMPPVIGGLAQQGQTLYAYPGGWTPAGASLSYQWQRSADGVTWMSISGATGSSYTLGAADGGDEVRVAVTAANVLGQSTATSVAVGPVPESASPAPVTTFAAPRWTTPPQISTGLGRVGVTLKITPATWTGSPLQSSVTQVMRCTNTCVAAGPANVASYKITSADVGSVLWVRQTVRNLAGSAVVWSARSVGPVVSAASAAVVLSSGHTALRNSHGATLAFARISLLSGESDARRSRGGSRVLALRRARGVSGQITAWVCSVGGNLGGPPPRCTARISLGAQAGVRLSASMAAKVRVVVVRRSR